MGSLLIVILVPNATKSYTNTLRVRHPMNRKLEMKSLIYLLPLLCSLIVSCDKKKETSENFEFATPEEMGMNADTLANIESMVMEFVDAKKFPGAVTLIAKNGKIIYESEVGWADSLRTIPYRKNHLFRLASMTKPIVSVATMKLVESGTINLNDPVSKYISAFDSMEILNDFNPSDTTWTTTYAENQPTIHQLLTHTTGISYPSQDRKVYGAIVKKSNLRTGFHEDIGLEEVVNQMANLPLMHEPGANWSYGFSTDVLGRVVEVASGMDLDDYIRENITEPIGAETLDFFYCDSSAIRNLTEVFVRNDSGLFRNLPEDFFLEPSFPVEGAKRFFSGGTGMSGTARDYFLFCQMILNGGNLGETQILKPATVKLMIQDQIDTLTFRNSENRFGYGFEIADAEHPYKPEGSYRWGGAFSTEFWIDPGNDLIVIQMRQMIGSPHSKELNSRLFKTVYNSLPVE